MRAPHKNPAALDKKMKNTLISWLWNEEEGVLSFEWVLLLTLLTIGIVSGLSAARDAVIDELADVAQASTAIDQSFTLTGISNAFFTSNGSTFTDAAAPVTRCNRTTGPTGQQGTASDGTNGG